MAVLRSFVAASMLLAAGRTGLAQERKPADILEAIKDHFKSVTPEFRRYSGATTYGETLSRTAISKEALAREKALFKEAAAAGLLKSLPAEVVDLGHNLIVHDPATGKAYLKALHESADFGNREVVRAIYSATLASGELGEQMAVAELASKNKDRRLFWARYLQQHALYLSSLEPIQKHIARESEPAVKMSLIWALAELGSPKSLVTVKDLIEHATDDGVQAAAIFTYAELAGFDGIAYVEKIKTLGEKSAAEQRGSLQWLKEETRPLAKHGRDIGNDLDFVARFGDLRASPVIGWLNKERLLEDAALKDPPKLAADKKKKLLDLLIDSKGFGLEAVKGSLSRSLSKEDEPALLKIRAAGLYSPNELSLARLKTLGIMIRQLRTGP
jgi:hypothetical protein